MTGLIVILVVTAYSAGALAAAPRLMRLIYAEKLALLEQERTRYEESMAAYKADRTGRVMLPYDFGRSTPLELRRHARSEGFWWSLVWPFSLAFHALGATAFAQEIAAERAATNTKIIRDYDKLLAARYDEELATGTVVNSDPFESARRFIRTLTRKEHS